jgi:protease-4
MDSSDVPPYSAPPPAAPVPPPLLGAPAPRPRKGGRGWMIFSIVLVVLLGLSLLFNFGQLVTGISPVKSGHSSRFAGVRLDESIMEDNDGSDKIAVIDVAGIITSQALDRSGSTMVDVIKAELDRAKDDTRVKAVVLRVDSPGGEVLASDEIYRAISDFQSEAHKPVVASMGNLAASGGYYISSASRWIVANEMTITGSIGVIMHTWNYRSLMDKVGVSPMVFKSGKFKDMLSGERETNDIPVEERAMVQALINETYDRFKQVVQTGRDRSYDANHQAGKALAKDWRDYADGRVLSGTQALKLGMVDSLGNFEDAVKQAIKLSKAEADANLIKYEQRYDLGDFLRAFGKTEAPVVKVDLGIDAPKLQTGRLYYLSPTFLH